MDLNKRKRKFVSLECGLNFSPQTPRDQMRFIRYSFRRVLQIVERRDVELKSAWKAFNILDCIELVARATNLSQATLTNCWKKLCSYLVTSSFSTTQHDREDVPLIAQEIGGGGFNDMDHEDLQKLLEDPSLNTEEVLSLLDSEDEADEENTKNDNQSY